MKIIQDYTEDRLTDIIDVSSANYEGEHTIRISFSDGNEKLVDFKSFLNKSQHPLISKYLNQELFAQFKIVNGNLNWNDYDMIFPIHDLYNGHIS